MWISLSVTPAYLRSASFVCDTSMCGSVSFYPLLSVCALIKAGYLYTKSLLPCVLFMLFTFLAAPTLPKWRASSLPTRPACVLSPSPSSLMQASLSRVRAVNSFKLSSVCQLAGFKSPHISAFRKRHTPTRNVLRRIY